MSYLIPDANALVEYVKDFTGSSDDLEIKQCIFLAEMMMRNVELPILRSDPYASENIIAADSEGMIPIPADMNRPILFFKQGGPTPNSSLGPWLVYDRIGDRDIITEGLIQSLYLKPINIPSVYRGKFSEVGQKYQFLPQLGQGDVVNLYYYKSWPVLFSAVNDVTISSTGTVDTVTGSVSPWTITVTIDSTTDLTVGDSLTAVDGTGSLGTGIIVVDSIDSATSFTAIVTGGTAPSTGTITAIAITDLDVQNNGVLQSWPEGYVYGTLHNYYMKRKMNEDASFWRQKFDDAWNTVEDQNSKGKWSGGHNRMTSIFQPRKDRRFTAK